MFISASLVDLSDVVVNYAEYSVCFRLRRYPEWHDVMGRIDGRRLLDERMNGTNRDAR